jgi:hypothetical protein
MKLINIFSIIVLSLILNSCEDAFQQTVDIKLPPVDSSMVPNAHFNNGTEPIIVINNTLDIKSNSSGYQIKDATVELFQNDVSKGIFTPQYDAIYGVHYYKLSGVQVQPGNVYKVKATKAGYPVAEASDTMPNVVKLDVINTGNIVYKKVKQDILGGNQVVFEDSCLEVKLRWTDALGPDYYRLVIANEKDRCFSSVNEAGNTPGVFVTDAIFEELTGNPFGSGFDNGTRNISTTYFNDDLFNGKTKEVSIFIPLGKIAGNIQPFEPGKYYFSLQHHSRSSYLYKRSVDAYDRIGNNNPFAQPVLIYSNYKGGFGILGTSASSIDSLVL